MRVISVQSVEEGALQILGGRRPLPPVAHEEMWRLSPAVAQGGRHAQPHRLGSVREDDDFAFSDSEAFERLIPLFDLVIAGDSPGQPGLLALMRQKTTRPNEQFNVFYMHMMRSMLHQFADLCQRQAGGGNVAREVQDMQRIYKGLIGMPAVVDGLQDYRGRSYPSPAIDLGLADVVDRVLTDAAESDAELPVIAEYVQFDLLKSPEPTWRPGDNTEDFLDGLERFPNDDDNDPSTDGDDGLIAAYGADFLSMADGSNPEGRRIIEALCHIPVNLTRSDYHLPAVPVPTAADQRNVFCALSWIDRQAPAVKARLAGVKQKLLAHITRNAQSPEAIWRFCNQHMAGGRDFTTQERAQYRSVNLRQITGLYRDYGMLDFYQRLEGMSRVEQLRVAALIQQSMSLPTVAGGKKLNVAEQLAWAVLNRRDAPEAVIREILSRTAEQFFQERVHLRPVGRPVESVEPMELAVETMPASLLSRLTDGIAVKAVEHKADDALVAELKNPQQHVVCVGTPAQVRAVKAKLSEHGRDVADLPPTRVADMRLAANYDGSEEDTAFEYTPKQVDALMAMRFRRSDAGVRHYCTDIPARDYVQAKTWIPGEDVVAVAGDGSRTLDSARLNAAIEYAIQQIDPPGSQPLRVVMNVKLGEPGKQRYVTIALHFSEEAVDAGIYGASVYVSDPLAGTGDDGDEIRDAICGAVYNARVYGDRAYGVLVPDYHRSSYDHAAAISEKLGAGDDGVLAIAMADHFMQLDEAVVASGRMHPDQWTTPLRTLPPMLHNERAKDYPTMQRLSHEKDDLLTDFVTLRSGITAAGYLDSRAVEYVAPLRYQVAALPNPAQVLSYPDWIDSSKTEQKKSYELNYIHQHIANLYFLVGQGKTLNLPVCGTDGHYDLGIGADSWMHKHQSFIDKELKALEDFAVAMQGRNVAQQRDAVKQLFQQHKTYGSAFYAGEESDAVSYGAHYHDRSYQREVQRGDGVTPHEYFCHLPSNGQHDRTLCHRDVRRGQHVLPYDTAALQEMHAARLARAAHRPAATLEDNLEQMYRHMMPTSCDHDGFKRMMDHLRDFIGPAGFDRLMQLAVIRGKGTPRLTATLLDDCFKDCDVAGNPLVRLQVKAIREALLTPVDADNTVYQYYDNLIRTVVTELALEYKEGPDSYVVPDSDGPPQVLGVKCDSFEAMVSENTSLSKAAQQVCMFDSLPTTFLHREMVAIVKEHNDSQSDVLKKVALGYIEMDDASAYHGNLEGGVERLNLAIREYLLDPNPTCGQKFFLVHEKGHYVYVMVNHKHRQVQFVDPLPDNTAYDPAKPLTDSKRLKQCIAEMQAKLRQPDLGNDLPAVSNVFVSSTSEAFEGVPGLAVQTDQVHCGDHAFAALEGMLKNGSNWCAEAVERRAAEDSLVTAEEGKVAPLQVVPVSFVRQCTHRARGLLYVNPAVQAHWAGLQVDVRGAHFNAVRDQNLLFLGASNAAVQPEGDRLSNLDLLTLSWFVTTTGIQLNQGGHINPSADFMTWCKQHLLPLARQASVSRDNASEVPVLFRFVRGTLVGFNNGLAQESQSSAFLVAPSDELYDANLAELTGRLKSICDQSNWGAGGLNAAWDFVFGTHFAADSARNVEHLQQGLARACAQSGVDLSKLKGEQVAALLADAGTLETLRYAATSAVNPALEKDNFSPARLQQHNLAELRSNSHFWATQLGIATNMPQERAKAIGDEFKAFVQAHNIDLAALRADPAAPDLIARCIGAYNRVRILRQQAVSYSVRLPLEQRLNALTDALYNYQQAQRVQAADPSDAHKQVVTDAKAALDEASTAFQRQSARVLHLENIKLLKPDVDDDFEDALLTHFLLPGEEFELLAEQVISYANEQGIDLQQYDWAHAAVPIPGGLAPDPHLALRNAIGDIVTKARAAVGATLRAEPPVTAAWDMLPRTKVQWTSYKKTWKQHLDAVRTFAEKDPVPEWGVAECKAMVEALLPAGIYPGVIVTTAPAELLRQNQAFFDAPERAGMPDDARRVLVNFLTAMQIDASKLLEVVPDNVFRKVVAFANPYAALHGEEVAERSRSPMFEEAKTEWSQAAAAAAMPAVTAAATAPGLDAPTRAANNQRIITDAAWLVNARDHLGGPDDAVAQADLLERVAHFASMAGINLAVMTPGDALADSAGLRAMRADIIDRVLNAQADLNRADIDDHRAFYGRVFKQVCPIADMEWPRNSNRIVQEASNSAFIDLAALRSTPEGMQVLQIWLQGLARAIHHCDLSGRDPGDQGVLMSELKELKQAVQSYQRGTANLSAVQAAATVLQARTSELVHQHNQGAIFAADPALRQRIDFVIKAANGPGHGLIPGDRAKYLSKLLAFLNAHNRQVPPLDDWPADQGTADGFAPDHSLVQLLKDADIYYKATHEGDLEDRPTVANVADQRRVITAQAKADDVSSQVIYVNHEQLLFDEHIPADASDEDHLWQALVLQAEHLGLSEQKDKAKLVAHLKQFCQYHSIDLDQLLVQVNDGSGAAVQGESRRVLAQLCSVVAHNFVGVYPDISCPTGIMKDFAAAVRGFIAVPTIGGSDPVERGVNCLVASVTPQGHVPDWQLVDVTALGAVEADAGDAVANTVAEMAAHKGEWLAALRRLVSADASGMRLIVDDMSADDFEQAFVAFINQLSHRGVAIDLRTLKGIGPGAENKRVLSYLLKNFVALFARHRVAVPPANVVVDYVATGRAAAAGDDVLGIYRPIAAYQAAAPAAREDHVTAMMRAAHQQVDTRLTEQLHTALAKRIHQDKVLDALFLRMYPGLDENGLKQLRMQVSRYMEAFNIVDFAWPTAEIIAAAAGGDAPSEGYCSHCERIVNRAVQYDAVLVQEKRLGVNYDTDAWAELRGNVGTGLSANDIVAKVCEMQKPSNQSKATANRQWVIEGWTKYFKPYQTDRKLCQQVLRLLQVANIDITEFSVLDRGADREALVQLARVYAEVVKAPEEQYSATCAALLASDPALGDDDIELEGIGGGVVPNDLREVGKDDRFVPAGTDGQRLYWEDALLEAGVSAADLPAAKQRLLDYADAANISLGKICEHRQVGLAGDAARAVTLANMRRVIADAGAVKVPTTAVEVVAEVQAEVVKVVAAAPPGGVANRLQLAGGGATNVTHDHIDDAAVDEDDGTLSWQKVISEYAADSTDAAEMQGLKERVIAFADAAGLDLSKIVADRSLNADAAHAKTATEALMQRVVAAAVHHHQLGQAPAPGMTVEVRALLRQEIGEVLPKISNEQWAQLLIDPRVESTLTSQAEIDQRLLKLFEAAPMQQLLGRLDRSNGEHAEARAHLIRAVLLTAAAERVGVDLSGRRDAVITAVTNLLNPLHAGDIDDLRHASNDDFWDAYEDAAGHEPRLITAVAPRGAAQMAAARTAAECVAERAQEQAMRQQLRADIYESRDADEPEPGTREYRRRLLDRMRKRYGSHDPHHALAQAAAHDPDVEKRLRHEHAMVEALEAEREALAEKIRHQRAELSFMRDAWVDAGSNPSGMDPLLVDMFNSVRDLTDGSQSFGVPGYRLDTKNSTHSTLILKAYEHDDMKVTRKVTASGGVRYSFKGARVPAEYKARALMMLLTRELYEHKTVTTGGESHVELHAVSITLSNIDPKMFGFKKGEEAKVKELLQNALKELHKEDPEMYKGEPELVFQKPGAPSAAKPGDQPAPGGETPGSRWLDTPGAAPLAAQKAQLKKLLTQPSAQERPVAQQLEAVFADGSKSDTDKLQAFQQLQQRAAAQQAAATGAQPPPPTGGAPRI